MLGAQLVDRAALDFVRAVACDEIVQPRGAGETDAPRQLGAGRCDRDQAAAVDQTRRHHDLDAVAVRKRQHPGVRGLDQLLVGQRALLARCVEQRLERDAERGGKRRHIGFLADDAPGDQHAIGADAGLGGAQFGEVDRRLGGSRWRTQSISGQRGRLGVPGRGGRWSRMSRGNAGTSDGIAAGAFQSSSPARSMTAPPAFRYAIPTPPPGNDADPSGRFVYKRWPRRIPVTPDEHRS